LFHADRPPPPTHTHTHHTPKHKHTYDEAKIRFRNSTKAPNKHTRTYIKVKFNLELATKAQMGEKYSSTLSLKSTLHGDEWSTPRPGRFTPRKNPVPIVQEAGLAPGPIWTGAEILAPNQDLIPGLSRP